MKKVVSLLALSAVFFSCKKEAKQTEKVEETTIETPAEPTEDVVAITLEAGDNMQYNMNEIKVPVGKKVALTLKHTGKMDKAVMGHNFVLLKNGVDPAEFATKATEAKDSDFIPASEIENIIAHTDLIGGGESTTVEFEVAEPGTYDYLCSFPAHFAMMKGKLIAE